MSALRVARPRKRKEKTINLMSCRAEEGKEKTKAIALLYSVTAYIVKP